VSEEEWLELDRMRHRDLYAGVLLE